jgi:hypothetical protein
VTGGFGFGVDPLVSTEASARVAVAVGGSSPVEPPEGLAGSVTVGCGLGLATAFGFGFGFGLADRAGAVAGAGFVFVTGAAA